MERESHDSKRLRDESAHPPEAKRLRVTDTILDILDSDDVDAVDGDDGVADVIRSFEEEIAAPSTRAEDLGFLLEASDDELGLPPAVVSPSCSPLEDGVDGFDRIWGFEDDATASPQEEGLGFGLETGFGDGVYFDGGLFDYGSDDVFWRTESLTSI